MRLPLLTGIISIATDFGLDVIAEGVENRTQIVILRKFAVQTQKILIGTIPQQFLSDFNKND